MIKKKLLSTITAAALITSMMATTALAAEATTLPWDTNGGSTEVTGDGYTVDPILEVELPGDLAFGINPLYLDADEDGTADPQIVSVDYTIINRSNVPVLIDTSTTAAVRTGSAADLVSAPTYDTVTKELKATTDKKNVLLTLMLPKTTGGVAVNASTEEVTLTANTAAAGTGTPVADAAAVQAIAGDILGTTPVEVSFLLNKAGSTFTARQASGFKFSGSVDSSATFEEADITVTTTYTLTALSPAQYASGYKTSTTYTGADASVVEAK